MKPLFAAFAFLTVIPVPARWTGDERALAASPWCFPLVGLFLGGVAAGAALLLAPNLPAGVVAVLLALLLAAVSGGLHLDGLADSADGLGSARPRERMLEIMRDSRIGTMGVLALVFVLLLKVTLLAHLAGQADRRVLLQAAFLLPLASRCSLVASLVMLPYARPAGLGTVFWVRSPGRLVWALAVWAAASWLVGGTRGLVAAGAGLVVVALFAWYCHRRLGGGTGDTVGAGGELVETVTALALAAGLPAAGA